MDRMSMLFANPRMSVLDFKDKDFDNLEQMLLEVAEDLNVDIDLWVRNQKERNFNKCTGAISGEIWNEIL